MNIYCTCKNPKETVISDEYTKALICSICQKEIDNTYCTCPEPIGEDMDGVWYCIDCNREIELREPDVDALYEAQWEQEHQEELDQL